MECSVCVRFSNLSKWFKNFTLQEHLSRNRFWLAAARPPWLNSGFSAAGTTREPLNGTTATRKEFVFQCSWTSISISSVPDLFMRVVSLLWALSSAREEMMVSESPSLKCLAHHRMCHSSGSKDMHLLWFRSWHGWVFQGQSDWQSTLCAEHIHRVKLRLPPCC